MKATIKFENIKNVNTESLNSVVKTDLIGTDVVLHDGSTIMAKVKFNNIETTGEIDNRNMVVYNTDLIDDVKILMLKGEKGDKGDSGSSGGNIIRFDTTANWNAQRDYIAEQGIVYVYTDYEQVNQTWIPAIKLGDGTSYLIDMPFVDGNQMRLNQHINDRTVHVTEDERLFWNNKVTCFISQGDSETVVFTKNSEE